MIPIIPYSYYYWVGGPPNVVLRRTLRRFIPEDELSTFDFAGFGLLRHRNRQTLHQQKDTGAYEPLAFEPQNPALKTSASS